MMHTHFNLSIQNDFSEAYSLQLNCELCSLNCVVLRIVCVDCVIVCKCVLYCCHRVTTQLHSNISYHINLSSINNPNEAHALQIIS
jgi:hypothetical protein